jgi:hypothetical protein
MEHKEVVTILDENANEDPILGLAFNRGTRKFNKFEKSVKT